MGMDQYLTERSNRADPAAATVIVQWRKFYALNEWMLTFQREQHRFDLGYQLRRGMGQLEERLFGQRFVPGWRGRLQRAMVFIDYPSVTVTLREIERLAELADRVAGDPSSIGWSGSDEAGTSVSFAAVIAMARQAIAAGKQLHYHADW